MRRSSLLIIIGFFAAFLILPGIFRSILVAAFGLSVGLASTLGTLITALLGIAAIIFYAYRLRDRMNESTFGTMPNQNPASRQQQAGQARNMRIAAIAAALVLGIGILAATLATAPASDEPGTEVSVSEETEVSESSEVTGSTEITDTGTVDETREGASLWQGGGSLLAALALGMLVLGMFIWMARQQAEQAGANTAPPPSEEEIIDFFEAASKRAAKRSGTPPPPPARPPKSQGKLDWHQLLSAEEGDDGDEDSSWWADRLSEDDEKPN